MAFYADEHNLNELSELCQCSNLVLEEILFSYQSGLSMSKKHFLYEFIEDTLQRIIPFGIPQHSADYHKWIFYGRWEKIADSGPTVFSLDSISFGFVI